MRLDPAKQSWMRAKPTRAVMRALTAKGGAARFVGGAVRNAVIGQEVSDVDIATPLVPEQVMARLRDAGVKIVPTGIDHGTVTAIAYGKPFEVTTLRRDVATDGRRATIAHTTDWAEDAARRDFTMNALYADEDGALFDPTGGLADLKAGRVRFVGDARRRIREDYLRILRLFRFHAWYGKGALDAGTLAAAAAEKAGLAMLSGERVRKEVLRLLEAKESVPALRAMNDAGILHAILPEAEFLDRLERLVAIAQGEKLAIDPLLHLAALLKNRDRAQKTAERLRLSNAARQRLVNACDEEARIEISLSGRAARRLIYRLGKTGFRDRLLLAWAAQKDGAGTNWRDLLALVQSWAKPEFPLDGRDALAAGVTQGPKVGRVLAELETWWVEEDFQPARTALLKRLQARA